MTLGKFFSRVHDNAYDAAAADGDCMSRIARLFVWFRWQNREWFS